MDKLDDNQLDAVSGGQLSDWLVHEIRKNEGNIMESEESIHCAICGRLIRKHNPTDEYYKNVILCCPSSLIRTYDEFYFYSGHKQCCVDCFVKTSNQDLY